MFSEVYKKRIAKLRERLRKEKLDAWLVLTTESNNPNVFYLSGFTGSMALLLITTKHAFIVVDGRYAILARRQAKMFTAVDLKSGQRFSDSIKEILESLSYPVRRIGFEGYQIPVLVARSWSKRIPKKLVPSEDLIGELREKKDAYEIRELSRACKKTSNVYMDVAARIRPGMREIDIAAELDEALRKAGARENSFLTIVASGPNSALPHHRTGTRRVAPGEPVIMDFGGKFESGYASDLTRTIFVPGKSSHPRLQEIYEVVKAANKKAFEGVKPGMTWKEYDNLARSYIKEKGYGQYFSHALGHSLGLEAHDPYNARKNPIARNAVITNEPGIYIEGLGGVRIEDDLLIQEKGAKRLTNAPYLT